MDMTKTEAPTVTTGSVVRYTDAGYIARVGSVVALHDSVWTGLTADVRWSDGSVEAFTAHTFSGPGWTVAA